MMNFLDNFLNSCFKQQLRTKILYAFLKAVKEADASAMNLIAKEIGKCLLIHSINIVHDWSV